MTGLVIVICLTMTFWAVHWLRKRSIANRMLKRESLGEEEVYSRFYEASGLSKESVIGVWLDIAKTLKVPADRLRPVDRFGKDIGVYWITSEDLDTLAEKAHGLALECGLDVNEIEKISTVDQYVRYFSLRSDEAPCRERQGIGSAANLSM